MNNQNFQLLDYITYPILHVNKNLETLWSNKKFKTIYKIKNVDSLFSSNSFSEGTIIELNKIFYEIKLSKTLEDDSYIVSFFDISKRKKLENKILSKQKIFESLSENLPLGIVLFSDKILYSNPTFKKMVNFNGVELKNKKLTDFFDDNNKKIFNSNIKKLIDLNKNSIESNIQIVKKNNKTTWLNIFTRIIREAGSNSFINVIKDITDERHRFQELEKNANYDKLTNIYNRRKFEELFDIEYKIVKRYKRDLSAIFFDIDHFKKVNDSFGHDIGDNVLKTISSLVQDSIRETDYFARWGGEEFIILLIETKKEEAYELAEKIRKIVQNHKFEKVNTVTISLGISQLKSERISSFLKRMDIALYNSKNSGRNTSTIL